MVQVSECISFKWCSNHDIALILLPATGLALVFFSIMICEQFQSIV